MAPALKEWAVVVHALLEGEQILDVRKGGLHEDGRHFAVQSNRLWLYPTAEHQKAELLKEPYRHWIDLASASGSPPSPSPTNSTPSPRSSSGPTTTPRHASAGRSATRSGCSRCGSTGSPSRSPCRGARSTAAVPRGSTSTACPTTRPRWPRS